jgi:hypothetical protein
MHPYQVPIQFANPSLSDDNPMPTQCQSNVNPSPIRQSNVNPGPIDQSIASTN